jgi:hypothetical protein
MTQNNETFSVVDTWLAGAIIHITKIFPTLVPNGYKFKFVFPSNEEVLRAALSFQNGDSYSLIDYAQAMKGLRRAINNKKREAVREVRNGGTE